MEMVFQLLIVLAINAFVFIILYFSNKKHWIPLLVLVFIVFIICIIMLVLANALTNHNTVKMANETEQQITAQYFSRLFSDRYLTLFSIAIWLLQCLLLFSLIIITPAGERTPTDHMALAVFITFVTYTMLPLSLIHTAILGLFLALCHVIVISLLSEKTNSQITRQVWGRELKAVGSLKCWKSF